MSTGKHDDGMKEVKLSTAATSEESNALNENTHLDEDGGSDAVSKPVASSAADAQKEKDGPLSPPAVAVDAKDDQDTSNRGLAAVVAATGVGPLAVPGGTIDVLFGRGVPIQRNHGNIRMHKIVNAYRQRYRVANRADKTVLVRAVIQEIRDGGARFLRRSEDSTKWEDVNDEAIYEKISHALRGNGSNRRGPSETPVGSPSRSSEAVVAASPSLSRQRRALPALTTATTAVASNLSSASSQPSGTASSALGMDTGNSVSLLANCGLDGSALGAAMLHAALAQGSSHDQLASVLSRAAAGSATNTAENVVASRLLQSVLARQAEQDRLQQLLSTPMPSSHPQLLDVLRAAATGAHAQQPVNHTNLVQLLQGTSTGNVGAFLAASRPAIDPQLANLLLSMNQSNGNNCLAAALQPGGDVNGSLEQQLLQQREHQARLQLVRQVETELALRRLAPTPAMATGHANTTAEPSDQHALLLSLLMGQSSTSEGAQVPHSAPTGK